MVLIVNGFYHEVLAELPMEFAVEAQKLMGISLEGKCGMISLMTDLFDLWGVFFSLIKKYPIAVCLLSLCMIFMAFVAFMGWLF